MNFRSTTAPFTVSAEPGALLSPADSAFYDVSVPFGKLKAGSGSLLCYLSRGVFFYPTGQASFPQSLTALQLPFANSSCILRKHTGVSLIRDLHPISSSSCPCWAYHKRLQRDQRAVVFLCGCLLLHDLFPFLN